MVEKRREEVRERHKILKVNVQTERTEVIIIILTQNNIPEYYQSLLPSFDIWKE